MSKHAPLDLSLEPPASRATVAVARQRRALVDSLVGSRRGVARTGPSATGSRASATVDATAAVAGTRSPATSATPTTLRLELDHALVVPAGALLRGYLRAGALLLAGEIVGNVHCLGGPVVIRAGASLKGRLVAAGDVYVCGRVADSGGGAVIATRGKLVLAPGAQVDGDVRSGRLELHEGAVLRGVARAFED